MANVNWYLARMWKSDCRWWWTGLAVEQGLRVVGDLSPVETSCEVAYCPFNGNETPLIGCMEYWLPEAAYLTNSPCSVG